MSGMGFSFVADSLVANIHNLALFIFAIFCFNLTPGPDFLLLIRTTVKHGALQAAKVVLGVCASTTTWNLLAVVGVSAILKQSPHAILVFKVLGALYLFYLGSRSIYSAFRPASTTKEMQKSDQAGFKEGFAADFLNPATGLFALTFFPQFVMPGYKPSSYMLLLTLVQDIAILFSYGGLILISMKGPIVLQHPRVMKFLDLLAGVLFIYFAFKLVTAVQF